MENNQELQNQQVQFSDEQSSFDIMKWIMLIVRHWYLFVLFVILSMGYTWWQNRKLIPQYRTQSTILLGGQSATRDQFYNMRGFSVQQSYAKYDNQSYIIRSHDFIGRVIDSLPNFTVEYTARGRFKTNNLYGVSPVTISYSYIAPDAYGKYYKLTLNGDGTFAIEPDKTADGEKPVVISGRFDEPVQFSSFFITVHDNSKGAKREIYFRFLSRMSLIGEFSGVSVTMTTNNSSIMVLSMVSPTPARDIDFLNKLSEIYVQSGLDKKNEVATRTINFIDEQMNDISQSLSASEDDVNQFRQQHQIVSPENMVADVVSKMNVANTALSELLQREQYLNLLSDYLNRSIQQDSVMAPSSFGWSEPLLNASVNRLNELIFKRKSVTINNPYYPQITREIEMTKSGVIESLRAMRTALNVQKNNLQSQMNEARQNMYSLPQQQQTMRSYERKYKVDDNYYTYFLQKRAEASIQKASNSSDDEILDRARQMGQINGNAKSKNISTWLAIGLIIPLVLIILKELLNNTIRNSDELEKLTYFPNIGSVRHSKQIDPVLAAQNPRSSFTEAFRIIRTRIEFIMQRKEKMLILVTSTESGDGKTYFSTNLASVYALTQRKTLLMDMDIRKPSIMKAFNATSKYGITDYLINECSIDEAITRIEGVDFDILPGGTVPPNPGELVRSDKLKEMLEILRQRYEFIVMDTSPVGLVADAYSLMTVADINLFVVRQNKTNKSFVKRILTQLKADKIDKVYSVLNDTEIKNGNYYGKNGKYGEYGSYGYYYLSRSKRRETQQRKQYYSDDDLI